MKHSGASRVLISGRKQGGRLRIWVIDDGRGIGRAEAVHVFDDYFQGYNLRVPARSGFGLGLGSVRRISALHGGAAALEPRWLRGAAFYIELPHIGGDRFGLSRRQHPRKES